MHSFLYYRLLPALSLSSMVALAPMAASADEPAIPLVNDVSLSHTVADLLSESSNETAAGFGRTTLAFPFSAAEAGTLTLAQLSEVEATEDSAVEDSAVEDSATEHSATEHSATDIAQANGSAADLSVNHFFNVNYNEAAGHRGFTGFEAFYPLFQTPGDNLTFLTGRVLVDNGANLGGGLQGGYRALLSDSAIWGVYGGFDVRNTGNATFTQLGLGGELIGDIWDLHLNANIPVGSTRQITGSSGSQAINPRFVGNLLIIDEGIAQQVESSITTLSFDAGFQFLDFGDHGTLWGRSGLYYLGGAASTDGFGTRLSLDYRLQNNLRMGLGLQHDGIFGTNVIFSVNALIGSPVRLPETTEENPLARLWARAGEPLVRNNTVLVEETTEVTTPQTEIAAMNPATGRDYIFRHVNPANGGTAGGAAAAAETPRDTIVNAVAVTDPNNENIIYVRPNDIADVSGGAFTIPDGVQTLSVGPTQQLNTQFGLVTLPESADVANDFPVLNNAVTIGTNTVLSGFAIDRGGAGTGIIANGDTNFSIQDNRVNNANRGITVDGLTPGSVNIVRNQISNTMDDGIRFGDINNVAGATINVSNNTISNVANTQGIDFVNISGNTVANITVANNQITNVNVESILFAAIRDTATVTAVITGNTTNTSDQGIEFLNIGNTGAAVATVTISGNTVSNTTNQGIRVRHTATTNSCAAINGNTVNGSGSTVSIELNAAAGGGLLQVVDEATVGTRNTLGNALNIINPGEVVNGTSGVAPCP